MFNFSDNPEPRNPKKSSGRGERKDDRLTLSRLPISLRFLIFFPELVHAAFSIDELLFAGEIRMADRADIELDVLLGGPGLVRFAAGAVNRCYLVVGMNSLLHFTILLE